MSFATRRRRTLKSVPARLTFWYIWTLGASLTAFAVFAFFVRAQMLYRELDATLEVRAHQLEADLRPSLLGLDVAAALAADPVAAAAPLIIRETPDRTLFRSPAFPLLDFQAEAHLASAARARTRLTDVTDRGRDTLRVATLLLDRPGAEPLVLQLAASTTPVQGMLGQLAGVIVAGILFVLGVASYGSTFTARRALAPVDEIVRRVRDIQANRIEDRLDIDAGSDELDRLVVTLNDMLDRMAVSVRSARRFAADASHELQTPIASMRTAVEMCLRGERTAAEYHSTAADLVAELDRLATLVRDLRLLALADAGHLFVAPEPLDLAALAAECCDIARAISEEKRIQIEPELRHHPIVRGSGLHLRRAILNVAENAIRYSPPASTVLIALGSHDGEAYVSVADRGCGIDADDLRHIFEPFYRADPARARETGGTGLGLAIADQIVRAHGGRIEVDSVPGEGSTFTIYIPQAH